MLCKKWTDTRSFSAIHKMNSTDSARGKAPEMLWYGHISKLVFCAVRALGSADCLLTLLFSSSVLCVRVIGTALQEISLCLLGTFTTNYLWYQFSSRVDSDNDHFTRSSHNISERLSRMVYLNSECQNGQIVLQMGLVCLFRVVEATLPPSVMGTATCVRCSAVARTWYDIYLL